MKKIRIVLAHGEHWARDYVRALIDAQEDMQVVAEAGDPRELSQVLSVARVDCLILRWPMGTAGSATALHSLKQACPSMKVLALAHSADAAACPELSDADGVLLDGAPPDELLLAIRTINSGGVFLDRVLSKILLGCALQPPSAALDPHSTSLSEREARMLRLLAWGYSVKEAAAKLGISTKTVNTYRSRFTEKLKLTEPADLVAYAMRQGWLDRRP